MKDEYKKTISVILKSYRKEKGYTLEKAALICNASPSSLSRIEKGVYYGHDDTLIYIFDKLGISFIIDPELIEYYDSLFDNMYLGVVKLDDDIVNEYHDKIEDNKDNILNSVCKHRYYAYEFIYRMYKKDNLCEDDITEILSKQMSYLSSEDKQRVLDYVVVYHIRKKDHKGHKNYCEMGLSFDNKKGLGYALLAHRYAQILSSERKYITACQYVNEAIEILKRYKAYIRIYNCYIILGNIYSEINETDKAISYYNLVISSSANDSIDKPTNNNINSAFHNILWCHVKRSNDKKRTYRYIQSLDNEDDLKRFTYSTFELVLEFFFKMKDKDNFNKWYDYFIKCNDNSHEKTYRLSKLLKDILDKGYSDDNLDNAFKLLDDLDIPYDEDEYVLLNDILIDHYKSIKDNKKADELYRKMTETLK